MIGQRPDAVAFVRLLPNERHRSRRMLALVQPEPLPECNPDHPSSGLSKVTPYKCRRVPLDRRVAQGEQSQSQSASAAAFLTANRLQDQAQQLHGQAGGCVAPLSGCAVPAPALRHVALQNWTWRDVG